MRRTVPPSSEIEAQIDQLLAVGVGENPRESLSLLAKLDDPMVGEHRIGRVHGARFRRPVGRRVGTSFATETPLIAS